MGLLIEKKEQLIIIYLPVRLKYRMNEGTVDAFHMGYGGGEWGGSS